ncbi:ABC transporter ATP-binding protein [Cupriavidus numazuensis]|uniref:Lipopolysaccharide export system ATP-binding protein LptB n=1 Tax=Cupriavidus numazuensis TaxID=221992 RepID=A0ABM8TLA5_9BURK|nr:ABC transporter ATP-binding protein [Cupriavidus numazuensis]CAG2153126.1 Lipopolysaccharide export system ATP-binding protein LptB [Cupriavidus numazuensis]
MAFLEVRSISKDYGGVHALSDVSFQVEDSEFHSVIGPNGAGKSTLINVLSGLTRPSSGEVSLNGSVISAKRTHDIVAMGVGRIFQNGRLFERLTVLENVMMGTSAISPPSLMEHVLVPRQALARQAENRKRSMQMLERFGLAAHASRQIGALSYGSRRLVEMAKVMMGRPKLLLLDEPAAGLNSGEVERLMVLLRELRKEHQLAVILIEHNMSMVMRLAERITVLNFGKKLAEGTPGEISRNDAVLSAYLGEGYKHAAL